MVKGGADATGPHKLTSRTFLNMFAFAPIGMPSSSLCALGQAGLHCACILGFHGGDAAAGQAGQRSPKAQGSECFFRC